MEMQVGVLKTEIIRMFLDVLNLRANFRLTKLLQIFKEYNENELHVSEKHLMNLDFSVSQSPQTCQISTSSKR